MAEWAVDCGRVTRCEDGLLAVPAAWASAATIISPHCSFDRPFPACVPTYTRVRSGTFFGDGGGDEVVELLLTRLAGGRLPSLA